MSKIADAEANATSLDGLVNDNALIPTLRNGPKPSYQYLVDGWNTEIAATILELNKSRGFRVVGTFADGFTYELFNDVGIDASGNSWIYVGAGAPNKIVTAGTVPSVPDYQQVTFNSASGVIDSSGGSVQDFIDTSKAQGIMPWDADTTYPVDGLAKGSDGNIYKAKVEQSGNNPVTEDGSNWELFFSGAKISFSSVSDLASSSFLKKGIVVSTGLTDWKVVGGSTGDGKLALTNGLFAVAMNGIWADDFSTDGTYTDIEIQAAFDYSNGTRGCRLGEVTYIINTRVDALTSSNSSDIYQSANSLVGSGKDKTKIINRCGDSWLRHKPSSAQAAIGARMQGFKLNAMSVSTDGSSLAGSKGAEIYSAWQGECRDYQETGMLGNAFSFPIDVTLNANPDRYSCGIFTMESVRFQSNDGIGLFCETPSLTLTLNDYYIVGNKMGGLFITGAAHTILSGAIAGNGINAGVSGFGLHLSHSTGFTQHNVRIFGAEIDNNYGRDIIVDGYNNNIECLIIQNASTGSFNATDMLYFNSSVSGGAKLNTAKVLFRVDNAGTAAINCVTTTDSAGTEDNHVHANFAISGGGSNVVKANLLGVSRQRNTVSEDGHIIGASHKGAIHNPNKAFIKPSATTQLDSVAKVLPFTTMFDDYGLWSGNKFTAPHQGLCTIAFTAPFRAIIPNEGIFITIKTNGATTSTIEFNEGVSVTSGQQTLSFNDTFSVSEGDEIEIFGRATTDAGSYIISDGDSTVSFRME